MQCSKGAVPSIEVCSAVTAVARILAVEPLQTGTSEDVPGPLMLLQQGPFPFSRDLLVISFCNGLSHEERRKHETGVVTHYNKSPTGMYSMYTSGCQERQQ